MLFYLNNWICSQLLNKKDNFAKKCLKVIRFFTRPDVAGVRCHPEGDLSHYNFHISGLFRGQNQPVDQVTAAALLKYGQKCI